MPVGILNLTQKNNAPNTTNDKLYNISGELYWNGTKLLMNNTSLPISQGGTGAINASDARTNLGLGSLSTLNNINNSNWNGTDLSVTNGGTGASDVSGARTNLGLGSLSTLNNINNINWSGTQLSVANGGTGQQTYTDGQLLIGNSSGNTLTKTTLSAGSGITITNGNGNISIEVNQAEINHPSGTENYIPWISAPFVHNNPSYNQYVDLHLGYQNLDSPHKYYIVNKNITITTITLIQNDETAGTYDVKIYKRSSNIDSLLITISNITITDTITKVKRQTLLSNLDVNENDYLFLQIKDTSNTIEGEEITIILEGRYREMMIGNLFYKNSNGSIYYNSGNIGIGNAAPTTKLDVSGTIKATGFSMDGHIIPAINDTYDIGSADSKIRDLYVADNSLWVGDMHKVSISNGKLKFRKRKTNVVPSAILTAGGNQSNALIHAGLSNITDMKLQHWKNYMRTLPNKASASMSEIFRDETEDYEDETDAFTWIKKNDDEIYYNLGNVGIGITDPQSILHIQGTDAIIIPKGTTSEQPTGIEGMLRYNTTDSSFEGYNGTEWGPLGSGGGSGSSSPIIETLASNCDGSVVTVPSGTYTMPNITTQQIITNIGPYSAPGNIGDLLSGSNISYKPPSGTNRVIYEFAFQADRGGGHSFLSQLFFHIDGNLITNAVSVVAEYVGLATQVIFRYIINCDVNSTDYTKGHISNWNELKELKLTVMTHNASGYALLVHNTTHMENNSSNQNGGLAFRVPSLKITAIQDNPSGSGGSSGGSSGSSSPIIEILSSQCDGSVITVPSGTYTIQPVTSTQYIQTSLVTLTGSLINYKPPAETTRVKFIFEFITTPHSTHPMLNYSLYIDSYEITLSRRSVGDTGNMGIVCSMEFVINCNADPSTVNNNSGTFTSWTDLKTLEVKGRCHSASTHSVYLNYVKWWNGISLGNPSGSSAYSVPTITIIAINDNPSTSGSSGSSGSSLWSSNSDKIYYNTDNVGIGIDDPLNILDIKDSNSRTGSHATGRPLYITGNIGPDNNGVEIRHSNGSQGIGFGYSTIYGTGSITNQNINIMPKGSGNVGIGNVNPSYKLDVSGNCHLDYSLIGRGFRSSNRGELHLNSTNENDVCEIFFGYGDGYTENQIRWGISDRGKANGQLNIYAGPALTGGFQTNQSWKSNGDSLFNYKVGIGSTVPRRSLDISGTWPQLLVGNGSTANVFAAGLAPHGVVQIGGHVPALNSWAPADHFGTHSGVPSDKRIKENIVDANIDILYDKFKNLQLREFNYISNYTGLEDPTLRGKQIGWIAQEIEEIFPKCIKSQKMNWGTGEYDDFKTLDRSKLSDYTNGVLIKVVNKVENLENQDFTGKHRCITNNNYMRSFVNKFIGQIVISIGKHNTKNINSEKNKDHITIDNSLPIVELSNKINQKNVLGVIAGIYNERIIINSIGEGAIWICNTNGNLENGDYITTSNIIGYGHKQDDDLLHNYTVAKITLDCSFDLYTDEYKCEEFVDKAEAYIRAFVPCIYFCG
jgi:hypothetical protein